MPIAPKISAVFKKKYSGQVVISWNGKILGVGEDSMKALKKAKKIMPSIESKEFLVSRIHHGVLAI
ncbi:MAG: hypothetical protein AAB836_02000 [Patescibacteria group bacterium]